VKFNSAEVEACRRLVELALSEDLDQAGDITSLALIPGELEGKAVFVSRAAGVIAGLVAAGLVVEGVDRRLMGPRLNVAPRSQSCPGRCGRC
jgi:nicotinate-nucleotide pyrophosphorylase (carboxylating)